MSKRGYDRLSVEDFGRHLLESGDLDPLYIAMHKTEWRSEAHMHRFLLAYWCLYNAGASAYISEFEGQEFWRWLHTAARNEIGPRQLGLADIERWPRGHERRHWRGEAAIRSHRHLMDRYGDRPEEMVAYCADLDMTRGHYKDLKMSEVAERVRSHHLFGPWIAFKVGDMIERLRVNDVDFTNADVFMFKDPVRGAELVFREKMGIAQEAQIKMDRVIPEVVEYLTREFSSYQAPPLYDRPVGLQEVETILCCWKSHMNGHYPLYNDMIEISDGLSPWIEVETARQLLEHLPKPPEVRHG